MRLHGYYFSFVQLELVVSNMIYLLFLDVKWCTLT